VNDEQLRRTIDKIVARVGRRVDEASPYVDARLADGSRVNAIIPPLAIHGAAVTIRKFSADPYRAEDLIAFGTMDRTVASFLHSCVKGRINILVSGGTGAGKTTTLNVLSSFPPEDERIITIEDAAELRLQQPHVVSLEYRPPNIEAGARSPSATWYATRSACVRTASSSVRSGGGEALTCSRPRKRPRRRRAAARSTRTRRGTSCRDSKR
jgi:Flp pilus assembly CpaF family ATPase